MFEQIGNFFTSAINGQYDFKITGDFFNWFFHDMAQNASISGLWQYVMNAISGFAAFVPYVLLLLSLVEVFFGKKLLGLQKFLVAAAIGYCVGVTYVHGLIAPIFPTLPDYISGAVIALVAAVLSKFIYVITYIVAAGYAGYLLAYVPTYIPFLKGITHENILFSAIVAVVFIILALLLRKHIEMFGTAALGGFFISKIVISGFKFNYVELELFGTFGWLVELIAILLIGLIGFIVQYKTRSRY